MRQRIVNLFLAITLVCSSGCIYLVVGGIGALGGYVVSPDTVEGNITAYTRDEIWEGIVEIISIMGVIKEKNRAGGYITAKVEGAIVTVTLIPLGKTSVKMSVKARRSFFPKIKLAQDVYVKIVNHLGE